MNWVLMLCGFVMYVIKEKNQQKGLFGNINNYKIMDETLNELSELVNENSKILFEYEPIVLIPEDGNMLEMFDNFLRVTADFERVGLRRKIITVEKMIKAIKEHQNKTQNGNVELRST